MLLTVSTFIGHFHPVLVHLPIGILLVAALFYVLSLRERFQTLKLATTIALLLGVVTAFASCVSGYLLSISGDYDLASVRIHQWFGLSVAFVSIIAYLLHTKDHALVKWVIALMTLLIFITGHSGGSLTHGSDYLLSAAPSASEKAVREPIVNVQEALVYKDLVQPLLKEKCYGCHNDHKQKGQLRLDGPEWIQKGGKGGKVVVAGHTAESELIKRLLLASHEEKHMPPKEKPQLTENEIALLQWWIGAGLAFDKRVKDLAQTEKERQFLRMLQTSSDNEPTPNPFVPEQEVKPADAKVIQRLADRGVVILPVAQGSHYLSANFVTVVGLQESDLRLLEQLKAQLIWLKLAGQPIDDGMLARLSSCTALTKLDLSNTNVSDQGFVKLQSLQHLQVLNVTGTHVTEKGLMGLKGLAELQHLYVFQSKVTKLSYTALSKLFPKAMIDTGGYVVPLLAEDTVVVKKPKGST